MIHVLLILAAIYLIARFALGIVHILLDMAFVGVLIMLGIKFLG
jgi:hypothetical protein